MSAFSAIGISLLLMSQGFNLTVTHKNGNVEKFDTQNIDKISFQETTVQSNVSIKSGKASSTEIPYITEGTAGEYYVGIVPRSKEFKSDVDLIEYINSNLEAQRKNHSADSSTESFTGLTPNSHYIIAAYDVD